MVLPSRDLISTGCISVSGMPLSFGRLSNSLVRLFALRSYSQATDGCVALPETTVHLSSARVREVTVMSPFSLLLRKARSAVTALPSGVQSLRR